MYDFKFADIGEGIHEGTILEWLVKEGDTVEEGQTLVIVETDKVNAELPSPVAGKVTKVGKAEGELINVGETVVIIDDGSGNSVEAATTAPTPEPIAQAPAAAAPAPAVAPAAASQNVYDFKFADIGEGIHEGTILEWLVKVGDVVEEGQTLVIVETDKVNAELPSPVAGKVLETGKAEGELINVGETVVLIQTGDLSAPVTLATNDVAVEEEKEESAGVVGEIEVSSDIIGSSYEAPVAKKLNAKALATPVARKLARDLGLDINEIAGSGENGRVLKADIESFNNAKGAQPKVQPQQDVQVQTSSAGSHINLPSVKMPAGDVEVVKISRMRKSISDAMSVSKTLVPHTVLMDEINVQALVDFRNEAKLVAADKGIKLTYMALIAKAVIIAIKDFPIFNASFNHETDELYMKKDINLGFAVDTQEGLIVPNIKKAESLSVFELASSVDELAKKAIDRKLQLPEITGGSFTITNFGSIGIGYGTPVIFHPELAILGVGKIAQKPVVENGEIVAAPVLPLSLAVDHRIIDGADGGRFLMRIKELLQNPTLLMLS